MAGSSAIVSIDLTNDVNPVVVEDDKIDNLNAAIILPSKPSTSTSENVLHKNIPQRDETKSQESPELIEIRNLMKTVIGQSIISFYRLNNFLNDSNKNELNQSHNSTRI